jgi:hypothetical protein
MNPVVPGRPKTDGIALKNKYVVVDADPAATRLRWFIQHTRRWGLRPLYSVIERSSAVSGRTPPEESLNNTT